jgi:hypothetical protein
VAVLSGIDGPVPTCVAEIEPSSVSSTRRE